MTMLRLHRATINIIYRQARKSSTLLWVLFGGQSLARYRALVAIVMGIVVVWGWSEWEVLPKGVTSQGSWGSQGTCRRVHVHVGRGGGGYILAAFALAMYLVG